MKNVILLGDNVIIRVAIKKKLIDLPEGALNVDNIDGGYPEVEMFSARAKEVLPELENSKKVILEPNFDFSKKPIMNVMLGMTDPNKDKNCPHVYFLAKVFDIAGIVVD